LLAPSRARAVPLRRLSSLRFFAERKLIASVLSPRSLAARLTGFCRFTFAALRGSCIAAFIPAMFRYPQTRALVTWPHSKSQRRNRLLIFRWGKHLSATLFCNRVKRSHHADVSAGPCEHPVRLAPKTMLRPTIRLGCVVGNSTDGTPGFSIPSQVCSRCGWRDVSVCRACVPFRRSFAAINFRRGTVRPKGNRYSKKDERS